jgi:transposase
MQNHAHLLATTRVIGSGGLGEKAAIEWSDANRRRAGLGPGRKEIEAIRERWAVLANERLLAHGMRIDHRSLEAQRVEREATVHLGPAVVGLERRGIGTEVGKRLEREALAAGQRRLERAAELGRVERGNAGCWRFRLWTSRAIWRRRSGSGNGSWLRGGSGADRNSTGSS